MFRDDFKLILVIFDKLAPWELLGLLFVVWEMLLGHFWELLGLLLVVLEVLLGHFWVLWGHLGYL